MIRAKQIEKSIGVTTRNIIHWCEKGLLGPNFVFGGGYGGTRWYGEREVFLFSLLNSLRSFGMNVPMMLSVLKVLPKLPLSDTDANELKVLVIEGDYVCLSRDEDGTSFVMRIERDGGATPSTITLPKLLFGGPSVLFVPLHNHHIVAKKALHNPTK